VATLPDAASISDGVFVKTEKVVNWEDNKGVKFWKFRLNRSGNCMRMKRMLYRYPFFIAASILFPFEAAKISRSEWGGDFWTHSAVVHELSFHLLHPKNPIIKSDIPHAFYSPYSLLVASFASLTHVNTIPALEIFAYLNLAFFLVSFYLFTKSIFKDHHQLVACTGLVLLLLFWGADPPGWSGFYHLIVLKDVLPYPSTFAMSLSFFVLSILAGRPSLNFMQSLFVIIFSSIIFVSHPTTFIFLFLCTIALYRSFYSLSIQLTLAKTAVIMLPALLLCLLWPYFNIIDLFTTDNVIFHEESKVLYQDIPGKVWPAALALPALIFFKKDRVINFLSVSIGIMLLVYTAGDLTGKYGLSRLLSPIMIFSQFLIGYFLFYVFETNRNFFKAYLLCCLTGFILCVYINRGLLIRTLDTFKPIQTHYYSKYAFLQKRVGRYDIILSDTNSNQYIPTFSGKVIAFKSPLYWVKDVNERKASVNSFFDPSTPDTLRQIIINKYHPDYLLIDRASGLKDSTLLWLKRNGRAVYTEDELWLITLQHDNKLN
jgi:hypothetical protein